MRSGLGEVTKAELVPVDVVIGAIRAQPLKDDPHADVHATLLVARRALSVRGGR